MQLIKFVFDIILALAVIATLGLVFVIYTNPDLTARIGCHLQTDNDLEYHACVLMNSH